MKRLLGLAMLVGVVALAVVIGERMSTDAVGVVVGVVFGAAASIPASLLVLAASRGRGRTERRYGDPPAPQVVILQSGAGGGVAGSGQEGWQRALLGGGLGQLPRPPASHYGGEPARRYRVVGEEEDWLEAEVWSPSDHGDVSSTRR